MATDQPTPPDLGNITNLQFLALADWSVVAANIAGKDDTFQSMTDCVVALLYRLIRDNFEYVNEAFACRVDTPLGLKASASVDSVHWRETDWPAVDMTLSRMSGVNPLPDIVFTCHGTKLDDVSGTLKLNPPSPGTSLTYANVSARGSTGSGPAYPFVFGIRTHAERWVYADDTAIVRSLDIAFHATFSLPEWPQDTVEPIVLAKVADFQSPVDVGANNRIGFEFGLGPSPVTDVNSNSRDYCLYVRWFSQADVEQRIIATLPTVGPIIFDAAEPIAITPGRRVTLGFHRHFSGSADSWVVRFYINGRDVTGEVGPAIGSALGPDIAVTSDLRLHIGSAQLGKSYTGGPVNNVMVWANPDPTAVAASMLTAYLRGEGFQVAP